jgi:hypothetical protein
MYNNLPPPQLTRQPLLGDVAGQGQLFDGGAVGVGLHVNRLPSRPSTSASSHSRSFSGGALIRMNMQACSAFGIPARR